MLLIIKRETYSIDLRSQVLMYYVRMHWQCIVVISPRAIDDSKTSISGVRYIAPQVFSPPGFIHWILLPPLNIFNGDVLINNL